MDELGEFVKFFLGRLMVRLQFKHFLEVNDGGLEVFNAGVNG